MAAVTIDGIPETLSPVTETAERPTFGAEDGRSANPRRRSLRPLEPIRDDEQLEEDGDNRERHVLDDLL